MNMTRISVWAAALAIAALRLASSVALGAGFTGTNGPGHSSLYSFSLGAGATNLSLNVSNTAPAFSHHAGTDDLPFYENGGMSA